MKPSYTPESDRAHLIPLIMGEEWTPTRQSYLMIRITCEQPTEMRKTAGAGSLEKHHVSFREKSRAAVPATVRAR